MTAAAHLVLLAGGAGGFDEFLEDSEAHQSDVLHHHWGLNVHCHQEQTESCASRAEEEDELTCSIPTQIHTIHTEQYQCLL